MNIAEIFHLANQEIREIAALLTPGVNTRQVVVDFSKYPRAQMYNKEWKSWRKIATRVTGYGEHEERVLWTKCCVCQKVTRASLPWWKRVIFIRTSFDFKSTFKPFIKGQWAIWGVCSEECLNMFYLGNEE